MPDFNGDNKLELIVGYQSDSRISIRDGNGDGSFGAGLDVKLRAGLYGSAAFDVDGDRKQDLFYVGTGDQVAGYVRGNEDLTFGPELPLNPKNLSLYYIRLGDLDGDGRMDCLLTSYGGSSLGVFYGQPDGSFDEQLTLATGQSPLDATLGDLNHDGLLDLAVSQQGDSTLGIYLGQCL